MSKECLSKNNYIGKILKCSSYKNELWYVQPLSKKGELITMINAQKFFKRLFISLDDIDMAKIPVAGELENNKNLTIRKKLKGKFLVVGKEITPIWYVNDTLERIKVTNFDFLDILSCYAITVNKEKLKSIIE